MDCSPPGSSIHGIFHARILEWVAISFSRGSSQPRDWTLVPGVAGRFFTVWATREAPRIRVANDISSNPKVKTRNTEAQGQRMGVPTQAESGFVLPLPFCSIQALCSVDGAASLMGVRPPSLLTVIQTLISPGNTLTGTPRNNVSLASLSLVKLTD